MEKTTKRMIMRVQGEGITRIAREQCYINHRFGHAMEILQGSLQTDQLDNNEIAGLAFAVLDGRAEIKGVYPDGDYRFEYNEEPDKRWRIEKLISKLAEKAEESEAQLEIFNRNIYFCWTEWKTGKNVLQTTNNSKNMKKDCSKTWKREGNRGEVLCWTAF